MENAWFTSVALLIVALVNELNYKNAIAFFTKAFECKVALNKSHLFMYFALVFVILNHLQEQRLIKSTRMMLMLYMKLEMIMMKK